MRFEVALVGAVAPIGGIRTAMSGLLETYCVRGIERRYLPVVGKLLVMLGWAHQNSVTDAAARARAAILSADRTLCGTRWGRKDANGVHLALKRLTDAGHVSETTFMNTTALLKLGPETRSLQNQDIDPMEISYWSRIATECEAILSAAEQLSYMPPARRS